MKNAILDQCVGQTIGNCHVEQLVSRGRISVVYRAQQLHPERPVAFIMYHLPETISTVATQQFRTRFLHEAPSLVHLQHPHLLSFYDYGEWEGQPYLITPYRTEGSLATRIQQQGPQSPARVLPLLEQIIAGLEYAHRNGQIHGMLTPANVLLSKDGSLEIAAIGLQGLIERRGILSCTTPVELQSTLAGTLLCAPKYLAPEYRQGHAADIRSDIYSLGVLLAELLQGSFFERDMHPREIRKQLDQRPETPLQHVLYRTLEEDPKKRFRRISDVLTAYAEHVEAVDDEVVEESLPQSFPDASSPIVSSAPHLDVKVDVPAPIDEFWADADFSQKWSPSGLPSVSPPASGTFNSPLQPRPLRPLPAGKISRRRTTALLAGGLAIGIVGIGGFGLAQGLNAGKATQTAQNQLSNGAGQTGQALNSAVAFNDTRVPEHRQRLLVHLPNGDFVAYKQGCTHTGVLVNYDPKTKLLVCPAHGAIFDPAQGGKVVKGPATTPLPQVAIKISGSGAITLV